MEPSHRAIVQRIGRWFDDRLGASRFARVSRSTRCFPTTGPSCSARSRSTASSSWSSPGLYLTFFFDPSPTRRALPRQLRTAPRRAHVARRTSRRCASASTSAPGLVVRQIHHWAALVFIAAIVAHLCRIFFTGAFRRPREINWIVGVTLLLLAISNGFTGYSLPDDLLSGTGLRIAYSIVLVDPADRDVDRVPHLRRRVPRRRHPPEALRHRTSCSCPARDRRLLTIHLAILWRQKHTQFPGRGRTRATTSSAPSCGRPTRRRASDSSRSSPPCSRCSAASPRSTPSGSTDRSSRRRSRPRRSPTGTSAGSRARCGSCRPCT